MALPSPTARYAPLLASIVTVLVSELVQETSPSVCPTGRTRAVRVPVAPLVTERADPWPIETKVAGRPVPRTVSIKVLVTISNPLDKVAVKTTLALSIGRVTVPRLLMTLVALDLQVMATPSAPLFLSLTFVVTLLALSPLAYPIAKALLAAATASASVGPIGEISGSVRAGQDERKAKTKPKKAIPINLGGGGGGA